MKSKHSVTKTRVLDRCIQCGICVNDCAFLKRYGDPKDLALLFEQSPDSDIAFSCSLCGLCTAVCPKKVNPADLFFAQRHHLVATTNIRFKQHNPLRTYEKMGRSKLLSWYGLPDQCDTIFFPGCALPGTRHQRVIDVINALQPTYPKLGVLLDCCTKPSHDLGDLDLFQHHFQIIQHFLDTNGINTVLVACPNCYRMFKEYGKEITVHTIYEKLPPHTANKPAQITIHDPCGVRFYAEIHQAVRRLLQKSNATIHEMNHHGATTLCCGEGGAVGYIDTNLATNWTMKRAEEAQGQKVITYCAGCTSFLGQQMDVSHLLDFLFDPEKTMQGTEPIASSPWTYYHRFRLKQALKKLLQPSRQGSLCT